MKMPGNNSQKCTKVNRSHNRKALKIKDIKELENRNYCLLLLFFFLNEEKGQNNLHCDFL